MNSGLTETKNRRQSRRRTNETFEYRKNGDFVLRIDYSTEEDGGMTLSAVSNLRSDNL